MNGPAPHALGLPFLLACAAGPGTGDTGGPDTGDSGLADTGDSGATGDTGDPVIPGILTAYFGYDECVGIVDTNRDGSNADEARDAGCTVVEGADGLETNAADPSALAAVCLGQAGVTELVRQDGLPVVLAAEVAADALDPAVFEVDVQDGDEVETVNPVCVTLVPANEENEDRTVLLIGEFGEATESEADAAGKAVPVAVRVAGSLALEDGTDALGASYEGPLLEYHRGPEMVVARIAAAEEDAVGESQSGDGYPNDCGSLYPGTTHVVRVIWSGGVTLDGVNSLEPSQTDAFALGVEDADGEIVDSAAAEGVAWNGLADLADGDNNVDLCLVLSDREAGSVREVRATCDGATALYDPAADTPCAPHALAVEVVP